MSDETLLKRLTSIRWSLAAGPVAETGHKLDDLIRDVEHEHARGARSCNSAAPVLTQGVALKPYRPDLFDLFPPGSLVKINVQLPCAKPSDPTCC